MSGVRIGLERTLEISGGVLSAADTVVQRRDGPRRLSDCDDDDGDDDDSKLVLWVRVE